MKGKSKGGRGSGKGTRNNNVVHESSSISLVIPTVEVPPTLDGLEILLATCVEAGTINRNIFRMWSQSHSENYGFWKGNAPKKSGSRKAQGDSNAVTQVEKKVAKPKVDKVDSRLTAFRKVASSYYEHGRNEPVPAEVQTLFELNWKQLRVALLNENDTILSDLYADWANSFINLDIVNEDGEVTGQRINLQPVNDFFTVANLTDEEVKKTRSFFPRRPAFTAAPATTVAVAANETE